MVSFRLDPRAVRRAFARAAAGYDEAAFLEGEVGERLLDRAAMIRLQPSRILDLGSGTGRVAGALKQRFRKAQVIAADAAFPMALHSRRRSRWLRPVEAVCADAARLPVAANSLDLVCSNLMLPWVEDRRACFDELRRVLKPGGVLLFTTFGPDTLMELRASWAEADDGVHVHAFDDMHHLGDELVDAGFDDPVVDAETLIVTYGDARRLLRELKAAGAGNAAADRPRGLTGKARFRRMLAAYEPHRVEGALPATFEVVYGHALAPEEGRPRRTAGGQEASFSVDNLRRTIRRRDP